MPQLSYTRDSTALLVHRHNDFLSEERQSLAEELGHRVALVPDATAESMDVSQSDVDWPKRLDVFAFVRIGL